MKTLILMAFDDEGRIFNASACGDNCAKWILKIAEKKDLTINLRHRMDFGKDGFQIKILNTGEVVCNRSDMLRQYENYGTDSGVSVKCDVPCAVLEGREWKIQLENRRGCILFTDEGNSFVKTEELKGLRLE